MIQKHDFKPALDDFISRVDIPYSAKKYLTDPIRYDVFISLLHDRLNQFDIVGYVKSGTAIRIFALHAFGVYAKTQLTKAGMKVPDMTVGI
jgi:hypothetical protein